SAVRRIIVQVRDHWDYLLDKGRSLRSSHSESALRRIWGELGTVTETWQADSAHWSGRDSGDMTACPAGRVIKTLHGELSVSPDRWAPSDSTM
ncbi:hypothetical protein AVEN_29582-1, partial [Araneus ventricosus]